MLDEDRVDVLLVLLSTLAHEFHTPVLASADDDNDLRMSLYLPDGSEHDVLVDQDDDGGIRNTPRMRRLIDPVAIASYIPKPGSHRQNASAWRHPTELLLEHHSRGSVSAR